MESGHITDSEEVDSDTELYFFCTSTYSAVQDISEAESFSEDDENASESEEFIFEPDILNMDEEEMLEEFFGEEQDDEQEQVQEEEESDLEVEEISFTED